MSNASAADAANQIFGPLANQRTLKPQYVGSQILLMCLISIGTIFVFNFLRPKNKRIYEPKIKYHVGSKEPPKISESFFGWLPPLIHTKEPELVEKIGLDAVAFLRFLRLLRGLFACVALLTCAVLIPVDVHYNYQKVPDKNRDELSMLTIRDVRGSWLYVHVGVTYVITVLVMTFVYFHWKKMVELRLAWYRSPEYTQSFYARTLCCMHVEKKYQSDQGIRAIFDMVKLPYPITSAHIGRKVGRLPEMIENHNNTVRELEKILVRYLKGGQIGKKRPTIRVGGFCGCGGVHRDAIDHYTAKLKHIENTIEEYRKQIDNSKTENYGFASLAAVPYAHIVANTLEDRHLTNTDITLASNPRDIASIWENMNKTSGQIARKKIMGFIWLGVVCFINTVPLFIISVLANLNSLVSFVPFLYHWQNSSPISFNIVATYLPPVVQGIFALALPFIMRWLSRYQGATTRSRLDRAVIARYFFFLVISQLFFFTLIGVFINCVREIVKQIGRHKGWEGVRKNLNKLPATINRTYIDQAGYWLTWFPFQGWLVVFDLAQIIHLLWISFKTRVFGRTPRDIREWTQPPDFQYAIYYSNLLFMAAVGLVFAPLAPLVVIMTAVLFWLSSMVYKYQLMFVFVSKVETGGRLWNMVINRLLSCVVLMQMLMILTIGLQKGWRKYQWVTTLPPIIIILLFKLYCNRRFDRAFRYYIGSEEELHLAKVHSERADQQGHRLEKRFGHPALHAELFTPMLHADMMQLLGEVYKGKINDTSTTLNEYGGEKKEAQVVPGGLMIAAVNQNDLEYDPQLYQRNRGEIDWEQQSMASTNILSDTKSYVPGGRDSQFYADGRPGSPPQPNFSPVLGYDQYLAGGHGVNHSSDIQLTPRLHPSSDSDSALLPSPQSPAYFNTTPTTQQSQTYFTHSHTPSISQQLPVAQAPIQPPPDQYPVAGSMQTLPSSHYNTVQGNVGEPAVQQPYPQAREVSTYSVYSDTSGPQQYPQQYPLGTPNQYTPYASPYQDPSQRPPQQ